ncbi:T9SS type A sorting domain-containing protein [Chryseobacterium sp. L7]|uniref:T9SS type A sorting domain-containing protein n=1 Tax=Chryseobacterium endalhagicum TaxID=2797638 RepID=A0ABS1QLL4_9FLAO|nr:choice-of-anchor J domain-containing protein [Chryseobacterium endalhagicum]MBL1222763.1 T9SS type A sorting domain-containing protein [Chryseobacterium endalhagicum]
MKLKLLLGTLMLTAFTANAQVATLNENFNNFTLGNTTFPQGNWSAVVAPITGSFPPVSPRMIVAALDTDNSQRFIQSYAGNNATTPSYLISPQIETPTGNKTLTFKTTLVSPSPGPGTIQIGVASSPTDMTTFVPVGNLINVTTIGTVQNISVNIPASTGSYIVFKFTPSATHVAIQVDDVVYNTSTTLAVNDIAKSNENLKFAVNSDNTALEFVTKSEPKNIEIYSAAGQKAAEGKLKGQKFDISGLHAGVYYMLIETAEGTAVKSKFIKK